MPTDNPDSPQKIALGKRLFTEPRLSVTGQHSCASCHQPDRHFTDGEKVAIGATGQSHTRNTPTLYNVAYHASFGWSDAGLTTLEAQHLVPLLNTEPVELGYTEAHLHALLNSRNYATEFADVFPTSQITTIHLAQALASYVRSIRAPLSAFDRYLFFGDEGALSVDARVGLTLFFSDRLGCTHCHASFNFSGPIAHQVQRAEPVFHVMGVSNSTEAFRAPTLRMVQHTAPYMHDGSIATLRDVIAHYQQIDSERVPDFELSETEIGQLIEFLRAL